MALISGPAVRARRDEPPELLGGEATVVREGGTDWIVLPASAAETHAIEPGSGLVWDLEAVRSVGDAVAFVRRFGLLRHGPGDLSGASEVRESFEDWRYEIARIRALATYVLLTHRGLEALRAGMHDPESIRTLRAYADLADDVDDLDVLRVASVAVQDGINERLGESRWAVSVPVDPDGTVGQPNVFSFVAHSTTPGALAYAYWQLADLIVARAPLAECEGCGRFFDRHDKRQRFHDDACRQRSGYERRQREKETER